MEDRKFRLGALEHRRAPLVVIVLALALALPSLAIGFFSDDYVVIDALEGHLPFSTSFWDLYRFTPPGGSDAIERLIGTGGMLPWWTTPELRLHFLRPLPSVLLAFDHAVFGRGALGWHIHSLVWYAILLAAGRAFFSRLLSPASATIALILFALSDANAFPFAWPSARHGLIATAFVACGVAAYVRFRRDGWRPGRWLAPAALVAGLLSSEAALGGIAFAVSYDLAGPSRAGARDRLSRALPLLALAGVYLFAYGMADGGAHGSAGYLSPLSNPGRFAVAAATRIPTLLADAILGVPAEFANLGLAAPLAVAGAIATVLFALLWRSCAEIVPEAERATLRWLALGALSSVCVAAGGFPGGRELLVANLGFAPIVATVLRYGFASGRWAFVRRAGAGWLALVHVALAPFGQLVNETSMRAIARATEATARDMARETHGRSRVFLVAASDLMATVYPEAILAGEAGRAASCLEWLSASRADLIVTRTGPSSFALEARGTTFLRTAFETLYRAPWFRLHEGDEVAACGARVRVAAAIDGLPSKIEVHSDFDLEEPAVAWLAWQAGAMRPFTFPAVGKSATIVWSPGPSGIF